MIYIFKKWLVAQATFEPCCQKVAKRLYTVIEAFITVGMKTIPAEKLKRATIIRKEWPESET